MNINSIQASQLTQNALRSNEKGDYAVDTRTSTVTTQLSTQPKSPQVSTQGLNAGINYLEEQLQTLLNSFPPFFPAGSPQRIDLIKTIKGLEEQVGKSHMADNVKTAIQENKLPEQASNQEISASIERLIAFRDAVKQAEPAQAEPVKPGTIVNVKV
ncbi:MAG: hypothetical protein C0402_10025 [Thermodesulfovibrio sp.]|nr:hypothetical protein [Thermodesulfovibrio sp.]